MPHAPNPKRPHTSNPNPKHKKEEKRGGGVGGQETHTIEHRTQTPKIKPQTQAMMEAMRQPKAKPKKEKAALPAGYEALFLVN